MLYKLLVYAENKNTANLLSVKNSQHLVGKKKRKSESKPRKQEQNKNNACYVHKMEETKNDRERERERETRNTSKGMRNTIDIDIRVPGKYPDLQYQDTVFGGHCTITILLVQEIQPQMKMHASITHRDI